MTDRFVVAVDVGGTSIKAARALGDGTLLEQRTAPTPVADGPAAIVAALRGMVNSLVTPDTAAVGVVVPGVVDAAAGVARYAANLGWRDVPLAQLIGEDTGRPVAVDHDVRGAGLAERGYGLRRDDFLLVIIGTGVAGVIVSGGRPFRGATDLAGELGHVPVYPDGEPCACGQRGCLEVYSSAAGIARRYAVAARVRLSAAEIVARAADDDHTAALVWQEAIAALGLALATATMLLDPAAIVLGGGLAAAGPALRDPVAAALSDLLRWRSAPVVEISPIADRLGLLGAARLAWNAAG